MHSPTMQLLMVTTAAIVLIIATAQVCGRLASRIGQPVVVGEMVAGVLLGPTAFGLLAPEASAFLFPADTKRVLYVIAMMGLSLYMFLVGLEHDSPRTSGRAKYLPIILSILGVLLPLGMAGAAVAWLAMDLKPAHIATDVYILFLGIGASVTAFPMLARMLQERRMVGTTFGATAIRAAAIDDALAWAGLAVVAALVTRGTAGLMNARGLMILVYMTIGLSLGIVETKMFSIMVLIAIVTTAAAMPIYRLHFSDGREEVARIEWDRSGPVPARS